ncbi:uncharacterized protein cfap92 [Polyodon spathula]|uniref:uncharacterized protein cfap92 n=1 Tax=Polyodon spathula TaxID=7913 RepID=UPI001B7F5531|nr:uncharacterized protein cfap92 [Polyodon spathula]
MESSDAENPLLSESFNTGASPEFHSPIEYDSGVATDDGGRETEREVSFSGSERGAGGSPAPPQSESRSQIQTHVTESSIQTMHEPSGPCHIVTCTVSFAIAIPKEQEEQSSENNAVKQGKIKENKSSNTAEAPKAQSYYHMEYLLLPDDPEPMKVDIVMYGMAAKIFTENETKVVKPWHEGNQTWLSWSQSMEIKVNKELLIKLTSHKIDFKIWDTKDRLSAKARCDKPKAFRLPQGTNGEDPENVGGVKQMIMKHRKLFRKSQPKPSFTGKKDNSFTEDRKESEFRFETGEIGIASSLTGMQTALSVASDADDNSPQSFLCEQEAAVLDTRTAKLKASPKRTVSTTRTAAQKKALIDLSPNSIKKNSKMVLISGTSGTVPVKEKVPVSGRNKYLRRGAQAALSMTGLMKKNGSASVQLDPVHLLAPQFNDAHVEAGPGCKTFMFALGGNKSVTDCLYSLSPAIVGGFCTVSIEQPLISEELKQELNPLVIKIESCTCLPTRPVPIQELKVKCAPVYCRYQFYNLTDHRTASREHGTHVYFKDVNVIFTGLLGKGEFREYLSGTPIEIEIHDRDRKMEKTSKKSALFGTEPQDAKISNVGLVSSQRTTHNPFTDKDKLYNPYGVAKLDLSDLLHGEKRLKLALLIHASPLPDPAGIRGMGGSGRIVGYPGSVDGPQDSSLPAGHYLESSSQLKVTVEIACPLPQKSEVIKGQMSDCPFGRIICIFDSLNSFALKRLNSEICRINAAALQLDSYPEHLLESAFYSYKLKPQQRESTELDIVTGFHIQDDEIHLFVLEGLKDKAIQSLWENIPRCDSTGERMLKVLYNSDLCFHQRLYASLDLNLCRVHLHKPLSDIMKQPLVYVRDMVPQACFQALSKLDLICKLKKLKDVTHYNLFPSSEMILSMSQEFGIPLRKASLDMMNDFKLTSNQSTVELSPPDFKSTTQLSPLDNYNEKYVEWKQNINIMLEAGLGKDFIQDNIHRVHQASRKLQRSKPDTIVAVPAPDKEVHNYSCQTMNSTEQAKELLRREMAKEPSRRFTYCQEYQSATVSPVNFEHEVKEAAAKSKAAWRTWNGFTYPGFKSSIECNEHEKRPSEARAEELKKPWEENILHVNTCAPTLLRDRWEWSKRHVDVELYKKPPLFFGTKHPITIYLAGDTLQDEQLAYARKQYINWLNKVITDGSMKFYRRSAESELRTNGAKLDRLQGMLKDMPKKHSLRNPGMVLKPIPALSVIQRPYGSESAGPVAPTFGFTPGLHDQHSLNWEANIVPRYNMEHKKFQRLKGADFIAYCNKHQYLYKRAAQPLTEEERKTTLFQQDKPPTDTAAVRPQPMENKIEARNNNTVSRHIV